MILRVNGLFFYTHKQVEPKSQADKLLSSLLHVQGNGPFFYSTSWYIQTAPDWKGQHPLTYISCPFEYIEL